MAVTIESVISVGSCVSLRGNDGEAELHIIFTDMMGAHNVMAFSTPPLGAISIVYQGEHHEIEELLPLLLERWVHGAGNPATPDDLTRLQWATSVCRRAVRFELGEDDRVTF